MNNFISENINLRIYQYFLDQLNIELNQQNRMQMQYAKHFVEIDQYH